MQGIGNQLRLAREAEGKSLEEIAAELRIAPHLLEALEHENLDAFSARVYAIGFLRTYAKYLGLNENATVSYLQETLDKEEEVDRLERELMDLSGDEPVSRPVVVGAGVIAFSAVILVWSQLAPPSGGETRSLEDATSLISTAQQIDRPDFDATSLVGGPSEDSAGSDVGPTETMTPLGRSDFDQARLDSVDAAGAAQEQFASDGAAVLDNTVPSDLEPNLRSGATAPDATALESIGAISATPSDEAQAVSDLAGAQDLTATEAEQKAPDMVIPDVKVSLYAVRTTWLRVSNEDGKVLFSSIIDAGASYDLATSENVFVATRDAGAIEIRADDKRVERLGRNGEVVARRLVEWSRYFSRP